MALGFLAGGLAAVASAQIALADALVVAPLNGQATAAAIATYTYVNPTGGLCPTGQITISFWWDSTSFPIGSVPLSIDAQKNCIARLKFTPAGIKGANTAAGGHFVLAGPGGKPALRAPHTIDPPPATPPPTIPPPTQGVGSATNPTPTASAPVQPTPTC